MSCNEENRAGRGDRNWARVGMCRVRVAVGKAAPGGYFAAPVIDSSSSSSAFFSAAVSSSGLMVTETTPA